MEKVLIQRRFGQERYPLISFRLRHALRHRLPRRPGHISMRPAVLRLGHPQRDHRNLDLAVLPRYSRSSEIQTISLRKSLCGCSRTMRAATRSRLTATRRWPGRCRTQWMLVSPLLTMSGKPRPISATLSCSVKSRRGKLHAGSRLRSSRLSSLSVEMVVRFDASGHASPARSLPSFTRRHASRRWPRSSLDTARPWSRAGPHGSGRERRAAGLLQGREASRSRATVGRAAAHASCGHPDVHGLQLVAVHQQRQT